MDLQFPCLHFYGTLSLQPPNPHLFAQQRALEFENVALGLINVLGDDLGVTMDAMDRGFPPPMAQAISRETTPIRLPSSQCKAMLPALGAGNSWLMPRADMTLPGKK